jgi:outer membrane receptor protein involved in Fe transport
VKGTVIHTGTRVRAAYRWQPERFVTAVNPYEAFGDQAYLSFYLRQPVRCGSLLPPGLEATVDVTNLLEQGYRPFLSADGQTLFLAQSPRTIQAGLAFSF